MVLFKTFNSTPLPPGIILYTDAVARGYTDIDIVYILIF